MTAQHPTSATEYNVTLCAGAAGPDDVHLASTIRAVDDGVIEYLNRKDRQRKGIIHDRS
jgi:hypothetical protein